MKFNTSEVQSEVSTVNFMDVGIHSDVELTDIKVETSIKGNSYISFTFTSADGEVLNKNEWQPTGEANDILLGKMKNQAARIKHIMTKFLPEQACNLDYDSDNWLGYANSVKRLLDPVIKGVKVRIKAIYDNNNYVTLPNYRPFIERMDIVGDSKLSIRSIDKVKKDSPDKEVPSENPFAEAQDQTATVAVTTDPNGLPF